QITLLRVRDHPLGHRAQALGLGHSRVALLVLEQLGSHVVEHEALVCGRSAEARALGWGWHCQLLLGLNQYCSSSTKDWSSSTRPESNPAGLSLRLRPSSLSFALTSSIDFEPKLRISMRSASLRATSSPTVWMPSRLRQL